MTKFFVKKEERTFTASVARARYVWLLVAALLLPFAASLSQSAEKSERFQSFVEQTQE